jgi:hypothetical protein
MIRPKFKTIIFTLLVVFIILFFLEIGMRLLGGVLLAPGRKYNAILSDDHEKIRILTLGESTTTEYFSDGSAWPRYLEEQLIAAGIKVRVYNEAYPAVVSAVILSHLQEYIDKYDPHIVITMMGVNDMNGSQYLAPNKFSAFLNNMKVAKLANWVKRQLKAEFSCSISSENLDPSLQPIVIEQIQKFKSVLSSSVASVTMLEEKLKPFISNQEQLALALIRASKEYNRNFSPKEMHLAVPFVNRAFELHPFHYDIAMQKLVVTVCQPEITVLLNCADDLPQSIYSRLLMCAQKLNLQHHPKLNQNGIFIGGLGETFINRHYRLLADILKERNITYLAMQYPTLPVSDLQSHFKTGEKIDEKYADIIFISNEENFKVSLEKNSYESLFTDRFQKTWGHTTYLGHKMISQSAFESVIKVVRDRKLKLK